MGKPEETVPVPEEKSLTGIERMYSIYEKLNSSPDKSGLNEEYRSLLSAVKGDEKEKRLASQFITRFIDAFPTLHDEAIEALLDLCEDDDISIRKQVVKDLITVCKKVNQFVPKIADVFGQLMQTQDSVELSSVQSSLFSLFHIDARGALLGLFVQIDKGEDQIKERCLKFFNLKLKDLGPEILTPTYEKLILREIKKVVANEERPDLKTALALMGNLKIAKTLAGQQAIVDIITEQIEAQTQFDGSNVKQIRRIHTLAKKSLPYFSSQISSTSLSVYFCLNVLPKIDDILLIDNGGENFYLEMLRMVAEVTLNAQSFDPEVARQCLEVVHARLLKLMPLPPEEEDPDAKFEFSPVECLLFVYYKIGKEQSDFITEDCERMKDFRQRLQYFSRATKSYMNKVGEDLKSKSKVEYKGEDNRLKITALRMTANINQIVRDLFRTPPIFKSNVGFSWRPLKEKKPVTAGGSIDKGQKRRADSNGEPSNSKGPRTVGSERVLYQPPSGKFSSRAGNFSPSASGFRGGGRGRGRGSPRGNFRPVGQRGSNFRPRF